MKTFSTLLLLVLIIIGVTSAYPTSKYQWVKCPDKTSSCETSSSTCCPIDGSRFGCCPYENAVCCGRGGKCCPKGYECNDSDGTCVQRSVDQAVGNVTSTCPDGGTCPNDQTCCPVSSEKYGCCKEPNAVCCSDGEHCCPANHICDLRDKKCQPRNGYKAVMKSPALSPTMMETTKQMKVAPANVATPTIICPNQKVECSSTYSCCKVTGQKAGYMCCRYFNGVCCPNALYCCKPGQKCIVNSSTDVKCADSAGTLVPATWLDHIEETAGII